MDGQELARYRAEGQRVALDLERGNVDGARTRMLDDLATYGQAGLAVITKEARSIQEERMAQGVPSVARLTELETNERGRRGEHLEDVAIKYRTAEGERYVSVATIPRHLAEQQYASMRQPIPSIPGPYYERPATVYQAPPREVVVVPSPGYRVVPPVRDEYGRVIQPGPRYSGGFPNQGVLEDNGRDFLDRFATGVVNGAADQTGREVIRGLFGRHR